MKRNGPCMREDELNELDRDIDTKHTLNWMNQTNMIIVDGGGEHYWRKQEENHHHCERERDRERERQRAK